MTFFISENVYEPAEDTFLLAENLKVNNNEKVLDIGSGCGIHSILSAMKAKLVVALDINPNAVRCIRYNANNNGVSKKIDIIQGNLFGPLKEANVFDLIIFNAPYLPTKELTSWLDYSWAGGESGREIIDHFLHSVSKYIKPGGRLMLVQSTLSSINKTINILVEMNFKILCVVKHKVAFETITLIEAKSRKNDPVCRDISL
jgi:release factor glutamine methyltransferase